MSRCGRCSAPRTPPQPARPHRSRPSGQTARDSSRTRPRSPRFCFTREEFSEHPSHRPGVRDVAVHFSSVVRLGPACQRQMHSRKRPVQTNRTSASAQSSLPARSTSGMALDEREVRSHNRLSISFSSACRLAPGLTAHVQLHWTAGRSASVGLGAAPGWRVAGLARGNPVAWLRSLLPAPSRSRSPRCLA